TADGQAVTANADGIVRVWSLAEDTLTARDEALSGQIEAAQANYAKAVERRPDDPLLRLERGRFFGTIGRWREAVADFDVVLAKIPGREDYYLDRARCHAAVGEWDKVAADCAAGLALVPDQSAALSRRNRIDDALARWEGAVERVAALRPKDTQIW